MFCELAEWKFEYLGKKDFTLKMNLGYESGDQVGFVDEKRPELYNLMQVYLSCI